MGATRIECWRYLLLGAVCVIWTAPGARALIAQPAQVSVVSRISTAGTITEIENDEFVIVDADGKSRTFKIQVDPLNMISVDQGRIPLNQPARIHVQGRANAQVLLPGMLVQVEGVVAGGSKPKVASRIEILTRSMATPGVEVVSSEDEPETRINAIGKALSVTSNRLTLEVPKHDLAPRGKLVFETESVPVITFTTESFAAVKRGDIVSELQAFEISSGELVVDQIKVDLVGERDALDLTLNEMLELKHHELDDQLSEPREVRSANFVLQTDMSDRESQILLDKLEVMLELVSKYYGKRPRGTIPCMVVKDLKRWDTSTFEPFVLQKLEQNSGLTVYQSVGNNRQAVVFSMAKHAIVQHEAVHGYCFLTFGSTGPLWYAEGMAEMGKYWAPGSSAVTVEPAVIDYLTAAEPQDMLQIIAADRIEGEIWKAYAWRWALCHLLANNPNYANRFKDLGLALLNQRRATFQNTFGDVAQEISFEYDLFVKNFGNRYRVDLCAWDWDQRSRPINGNRTVKTEVAAAKGWQPTALQLSSGTTYRVETSGSWQIEPDGADLSAAGDEQGNGRLIAAIFDDYQLSAPFELGNVDRFTAPSDGQLVVRCADSWTRLSDNQGEITLTIGLDKE